MIKRVLLQTNEWVRALAAASAVLLAVTWGSAPVVGAAAKPVFSADGEGNLVFDTGVVKGSLKKDGLGGGLKPISFIEPNLPIDNNHGLIVPYRFLTPQNPNNWAMRPMLAGTLGIRQEPKSGVTVLIMAPPEDCFALSMSQQEAGLGAYYLSLFGKDVKRGQSLTGHARLVFGRNITDDQALEKYQQYLRGFKR